MSIFTDLNRKVSDFSDSAYNYILPRSAIEYAGSGLNAAGRLAKDLVTGSLSTFKLGIESLISGAPAGLKSVEHFAKALFVDLPKAAYHKYQQEDDEMYRAFEEANNSFFRAGGEFVEAVSTGASTAYQGLKPILFETASSLVNNGGEVVLDAGAVAAIAVVEAAKFTGQTATTAAPILLGRIEEVGSKLEKLAIEQASSAYQALPSSSDLNLLPSFLTRKKQEQNVKKQSEKPWVSWLRVGNRISI